jgi:HPt (histidine-containing phosphotransfer) domain-containing protein
MDDYISKPVRILELQAAIERWGPTKIREFDTATFLARQAGRSSDELLDESILDELRSIPPTDGIPMVRELIDLFLESAPAHLEQIRAALSDPAQLKFHAHTLKSMSMTLGARKVVMVCQQLEKRVADGSLDAVPALSRELETVFDQTRNQLLPLREG